MQNTSGHLGLVFLEIDHDDIELGREYTVSFEVKVLRQEEGHLGLLKTLVNRAQAHNLMLLMNGSELSEHSRFQYLQGLAAILGMNIKQKMKLNMD